MAAATRTNTQSSQSSIIPSLNDRTRVKKRIIVCCDGTWEDGVTMKDRWMYTNILRLARSINHEDERFEPPIPQVVFYQPGIGSEHNVYAEYVQGTTGASLAEKVQEAYAFIAHNYQPGDDIFLFGFSRGAYTARMVAMFIGAIGVLDRTEMDHFAGLFIAFQKRGKSNDQAEIAKLDKQLAPWTSHDSPGKKRADSDQDTFSIKCVGVFDTVGSLGLPDELRIHSPKVTMIFGFPDKLLGEHIQYAFQALALNETRKDFDCTKFVQSEGGKRKKQILKQCWFTGSHSDIGGGWHDHDLADLTLTWMAANIGELVSLDLNYVASLPDPVAPWGEQRPHDPRTGVFSLSDTIQRKFPTAPNPATNETIHPSVLKQSTILPALQEAITTHPDLIHALMPLEEDMKNTWPYVPGKNPPKDLEAEHLVPPSSQQKQSSFLDIAIHKGTEMGMEALKRVTTTETMRTESGEPVYERNRLAKLAEESHIGAFIKEIAPHVTQKH